MDIDRGKVRIGIDAPRDVPVYREELLPLRPSAFVKPVPVPPEEPQETPPC